MERILIIDDEVEICQLLERFLSRKGYVVDTAYRGKDGLQKHRKNPYDLIITDFRLPDISGLDLLKEAKSIHRSIQVIVITGYSDIRMAVEVIKYGAFDYVTKPLYPEELLHLVQDALKTDNTEREEIQGKTEEKEDRKPDKQSSKKSAGRRGDEYLIGNSAKSRNIYKNLEIVAPTNMSVLITGETGTGKEYVAREIHKLSKRSEEIFIALDCGALPKDIAGSEFFGHEKGAFTGASTTRDGKFKLADGGTLFLDEIGNLTYDIQLKLLRVLQERKFSRIGGSKDFEVDVRIIAATNENLKALVDEGRFREDLYYRLNEFHVALPPLRSRKEELKIFTDKFIEDANAQLEKEVTGLSEEVAEKFEAYSWPGNLRELRNVLKRCVLLSQGEYIGLETLPEEIIYGSEQGEEDSKDSLRGAAHEAERERILEVLAETGNNKSKAARILNIDRKTLYNKLKNYNI
ncbi:MAG TPA: sigma-54 dependent transcriptional regulator [Cryomorphaceae bacterium]|nr:sigma-54 dependent transcriptional regulator [Cryomorphaceae bacterium]